MNSFINRSSSICRVTILVALFLWLGSIALQHSTIESAATPIQPALVFARTSGTQPPERAVATPLQQTDPASSNPVSSAFINAVPGAEGATLYISVSGVDAPGTPIVLNINPGSGPGHHIGSYAMTISSTAYVATAIGFTPGQDVGSDGDDTMSITTTVGDEIMSSGAINFQRTFVETSQPETISIDDSDFLLEMPNIDTFSQNVYVLVMSTNAAPGSLPIGYRFASSTYNVRPSHSLTESEKWMTLNLRFLEPLPGGGDPHTLAVVGWDAFGKVWDVLGGDLLDDDHLLTLAAKRFRIYALATIPAWRDTFQELSLTGVSEQSNTVWGPGQTIILSGSALSGTVTSLPVTPAGAAHWGTLHFSATVPLSTGIKVDVLTLSNTEILTNTSDGTDLSGLSLEIYPALKLRATLARTGTADPTPRLHVWQVSWTPEVHDVYLPIAINNEP